MSEIKPKSGFFDVLGKFVAVIFLLVIGLAMLGTCSGQQSGLAGSTSNGETTWTPPEGYDLILTKTSDRPIGYQWLSSADYTCKYGKGCFGVEFITNEACPSFYAAITLDSEGNNVGYTNETTQGVQPGEKVKLIFETYNEDARSARMAEVSCY